MKSKMCLMIMLSLFWGNSVFGVTGDRLASTKDLCQNYVSRFMASETNLLYSKPLDTPYGLGLLETTTSVDNEMVAGQYMPYGYGSGIEDTAYHNGTFLYALCEAYDATNDAYFYQLAQQVFSGLQLMGNVSSVAGFVPRGPHPSNGTSYYKDSSVDQHMMYFCGLWRYYHSAIATSADKAFIAQAIDDFATRMQSNGWELNVEDNSRQAHASGGNWYWRYWSLLTTAMAADIAGSSYWQGQYDLLSSESNEKRWNDMMYQSPDLPRYILYYNQNAFNWSVLSSIETDYSLNLIPQSRMNATGNEMLSCNFFSHYYRRDWVGETVFDDDINIMLEPLNYTVDSDITIYDLWDSYDSNLRIIRLPNGSIVSYKKLWMYALMASHIGLLSNDQCLIERAEMITDDIFSNLDFSNEDDAWLFNYAVVTSLLSLAVDGSQAPELWANQWQNHNGNWFDVSNWSEGVVPDYDDDTKTAGQITQIPANTSSLAIQNGQSASAFKLQIGTTVYAKSPAVMAVNPGGALTCKDYILLANNMDTYAVLNQFGGTVSAGSYLTVGGRGQGVYNVNGGTLNVSGTVSIPSTSIGSGTFNLNSGTVNVGNGGAGVNIGPCGTLNVNGGIMAIDGQLRIWREGGQINVRDGDIYTNALDLAYGQVTLSGGGRILVAGDITARIEDYINLNKVIAAELGYDVVCRFDGNYTVISAEYLYYYLWDGSEIPTVDNVGFVEGVEHFKVHQAIEGEYQFLHGASIIERNGVLYTSWANSPIDENSQDECVRQRRSYDKGRTWEDIEVVAPSVVGSEANSHGVYFSYSNKLWFFAAHFQSGGTRTDAYLLDESQQWQFVKTACFRLHPFDEPQQMPNGQWIVGGNALALPRVGVFDDDDILNWTSIAIPLAEGTSLLFPETSVWVDGDKVIAVIRNSNEDYPLISVSYDYGQSWSVAMKANYPMAAAKPYCGTLSTGQKYLISNIDPTRDNLVIAVTTPCGDELVKVWKIRSGVSAQPLYPGFAKTPQWSYPAAVEYDGNLYVVYSTGKEDCDLSIIPVESLYVRPEPGFASDINNDCRVDVLDLAILAQNWLMEF